MPGGIETWTVGQHAAMACMLECLVPKPGNVHRGADFQDLTILDFSVSAIGLGHFIDQNQDQPTGQLIRGCVEHTQSLVDTNTNLGICLLLIPLVKATVDGKIESARVQGVLAKLDADDTNHVYQAIRMANAGGMGTSNQHDLHDDPPADLIEAMKLAESRDMIARQYANDFEDLFGVILPELRRQLADKTTTQAIVATHLFTMSKFPDSLIQRKCGEAVANQSAGLAAKAYEVTHDEDDYLRKLAELDFWLREDGHRRNPGTTADLICTALFVLLVNGELKPRFT